MANGNQRQSDETSWKIQGIRAERATLQKRIEYLQTEERRLTGAALTGTPQTAAKPKAATGKAPVRNRKRQLSPETRAKMREAAQKRWKKGPYAADAATIQTEVPPPMAPDTFVPA